MKRGINLREFGIGMSDQGSDEEAERLLESLFQ